MVFWYWSYTIYNYENPAIRSGIVAEVPDRVKFLPIATCCPFGRISNIILCEQTDQTIRRKSIRLVNCDISSKMFTKSKPSRDKGQQEFEEGCMCKP